MKHNFMKKIMASILTMALTASLLPPLSSTALAAENQASPTIIVDMMDDTGEIFHGATGLLHGMSSEDVPAETLITPLKPKVLASGGSPIYEHPYGDALDVAESFFRAGGEYIHMYNNSYFSEFAPPSNVATTDYYVGILKDEIVPHVLEWKNKWKEKHHYDEKTGLDDLGIDIDKAIVYVPINESNPTSEGLHKSWKKYYDTIKELDPRATVGGPNNSGYVKGLNMRSFLTFCKENDCIPDVITWHELHAVLQKIEGHFADYRQVCADLGIEERPVVVNEYADGFESGVPGRLVHYIGRFEDAKAYACLPFWHQPNNLDDLAAGANEPGAAWWLYKWYADMTGNTRRISEHNTTQATNNPDPMVNDESNASYGLYGVSSLDEEKKMSTTLFGGEDGRQSVILKDLDDTDAFKNAEKVHVKIDAIYYKGFSGVSEPETVCEGTFPLENGHLTIDMDDTMFSTAYKLTVTPAKEQDEADGNPLTAAFHAVYEAEDAKLEGSLNIRTNHGGGSGGGSYFFSGAEALHNRGKAVQNFRTGSVMTYTIEVPADGKYKLEFVYGNGTGAAAASAPEAQHNPQNVIQRLSVDGGEPMDMVLENTLSHQWVNAHVVYQDLTAGTHTLAISGNDTGNNQTLHDMLHVTYAGVYQQPLPGFHTLYEAEEADFDFNMLPQYASKKLISTETKLSGYTGNGYVTGLDKATVSEGGGIRFSILVEESGLYHFDLRYCSGQEGKANIYINNGARAFTGVRTDVNVSNTAGGWDIAATAVYLQKGMNIVDIDATAGIALDSLRITEGTDLQEYSETIKATEAIPDGAQMKDVEYDEYMARPKEGADVTKPATNYDGYEVYKLEPKKTDKIAKTALSLEGEEFEYVVGRSVTGDKNALEDPNKYLEFKVTVAEGGTYAMQVFHSNEEKFGYHSFNVNLIDKYASIKVNDQEPKKYFFKNTLARDTFDEKTIYVDLEAGENTIRVFNDDSSKFYKALRQGRETDAGFGSRYFSCLKADIPLVNSLPNISKFVITPTAVKGLPGKKEHKIKIRTSAGGLAVADKNVVEDQGTVNFTITELASNKIESVLVNGESKMEELVPGDDGIYMLTIYNVASDVELQVKLAGGTVPEGENDPDSEIKNNSFGTGDTQNWDITTTGISEVLNDTTNRYNSRNYIRLSGDKNYKASLGQTITVAKKGNYALKFAMKNSNISSAVGGFNSLWLNASVNGVINISKVLTPNKDYQIVEGYLSVPSDKSKIDFSIEVDAKAGFEIYLDEFTLTKVSRPAGSKNELAYFVDCGDQGPTTLSEGDSFGIYNSVTDQVFGEDEQTGKQWGVLDPGGTELRSTPRGGNGVYTKYTWANENYTYTREDGRAKTESMRYARDQYGNESSNPDRMEVYEKVGELFVDYKFELEADREYDVEVCVGRVYNSANSVNIYANRGHAASQPGTVIAENVSINSNATQVVKGTVAADDDGYLTINVRRPYAPNDTINVHYIKIYQEGPEEADKALEELREKLEQVKVLPYQQWCIYDKEVAEKAVAFAESILAAGTRETAIISNAVDSLEYVLTFTEEIIVNGSIDGTDNWTSHLGAGVGTGSSTIITAPNSLKVTGTAKGSGVKQNITGKVKPGRTYDLKGSLIYKQGNSDNTNPPDDADFNIVMLYGGQEKAQVMISQNFTLGKWGEFSGSYTVPEDADLSKVSILFESPAISADGKDLSIFYVDEVSMRLGTSKKVAVTGVTVEPQSAILVVNGTQQLTAVVKPENATNKNVIWSSSDESIATVSEAGLVTAKAVGKAAITATTEDGGKNAVCEVTVGNDSELLEEIKKLVSKAEELVEDAKKSAEAAAQAEKNAKAAKDSAEAAKDQAETVKGEAQAAKTAAETAQTKAENAQKAAETARKVAEDMAADAAASVEAVETARATAEAARDAAETAKNDAENAKTAALIAQISAEDAQRKAEEAEDRAAKAGEKAQTAAQNAQTAQTNAQTAMDKAKEAQEAAEDAAADAAGARDAAEAARRAVEEAKNSVMQARADTEAAREEAETAKADAQKAQEAAEDAAETASVAVEAVNAAAESAAQQAKFAEAARDLAKDYAEDARAWAEKAEDAYKKMEEMQKANEERHRACEGKLAELERRLNESEKKADLDRNGEELSDGKLKYAITDASERTVEVTGACKDTVKKVTIPDTVKSGGITYQVTAIRRDAFRYSKNLQSVVLGKNVKSIGQKAFYGCKKLAKARLGRKVKSIGVKAFYGCKKLKGITVQTKKLTKQSVGSQAFKGIHSRAVITVPKAKLGAYKKLLQTKGLGKKVKFKK